MLDEDLRTRLVNFGPMEATEAIGLIEEALANRSAPPLLGHEPPVAHSAELAALLRLQREVCLAHPDKAVDLDTAIQQALETPTSTPKA